MRASRKQKTAWKSERFLLALEARTRAGFDGCDQGSELGLEWTPIKLMKHKYIVVREILW
jgi:hypothetical protein